MDANFRRWMLERKLADAEVSEEEQNNILKNLEKKETEYMRRQRHKMGVDDFELLTIIGRGAFGEVILCLSSRILSYIVCHWICWGENFIFDIMIHLSVFYCIIYRYTELLITTNI